MNNFITIVKLVAQLYPVLMQIIKSIEEALPDSGQGPAKLELVKQTLKSAYDSMGDAQMKFEQIWPTISGVVGAIVTMLNASGAFKKKS